MKTLALFATLSLIGLGAFAAEPLPLQNDSAKWGWTAFGHGVDDSGVNASERFFWVAVNWTASTWGNGMFFKTEAPIDVTPYKKLTVSVSAQQPSKTKIQLQLLTADHAVLGTNPAEPFLLKDVGETVIVADISQMVPVQAEKDQREFIPDQDLKKVDRVQIIFLKPEGDETKNVLKFKEMKLLP